MKNLLIILMITLISCKKDVIQPTTPPQQTEQNTFVKIKTQVSPINSETSFYNTMDKSYFAGFDFLKNITLESGEQFNLGAAWSIFDLDKDGDDDFIIASNNFQSEKRANIYIFKNENNKLIFWKKLPGLFWGRKGILGDYDKNGYLDFLVASHGFENPSINYYPGDEIGIVYFFKDSVDISYIDGSKEFNHTAASGDIDNDGDIDIITADSKYINNGNKKFNKTKSVFASNLDLTTKINVGYYHNELYDLNNDGNLDLLMGCSELFGDSVWDGTGKKFNGRNRIYWGDGSGNYYYSNSTQLQMTYPETKDTFGIVDDFNFYDFNKDGYEDIIIFRSCWRGAGYYIQFLENNKDKTFKEVSKERMENYKLNLPNAKPNEFEWLVWIRFVDLNKDNKLDIIGREGSKSEMKWINDGNNFFKLQ